MTTLSVKLPKAVVERLAAEARAHQKSKSMPVREFIERDLSGATTKRGPSLYALAKDKAGRFRRPGDLATNPKYMETFGK